MASKKDFDIGDLVWAKMKGFPFWPGEIANPPTDARSAKKAHHYVFFFGTENFAWILDENIVLHSAEMLKSALAKKKSTLLKTAIEEISEKAPKTAKSPVQEKESPEVSTSGTEKKVAKARRIKSKTPKIHKKIVPKKRALDESTDGTSPPHKLSRKTENFSELINNTPPNLNYDRVAVVKPLDERSSTEMTWHDYYTLEPGPPLNLSEPNARIIAKNVIPSTKQIGFIGLGLMGQRLVKNLLTTRHKVMVWNRTAKKCEDFVEAGALVAKSPADLIEKCDVVFCCVSGPDASKSIVFGNCGILTGLAKSAPGTKGYIEMTTLDPETAITLSEAIIQKGGQYLEAPITGSFKMAEEGSLFILTAGSVDLFSACQSCFFALGETAYFLGYEIGTGSKMNLVVSMVIGISHAALAEAMALVGRLELSEQDFLEIVELGPLNSRLVKEKGKAMLSRYFATDSSLKYQQRDLYFALMFGSSCEQPLPVTAAANEVFKHARRLRYSDHDVSAVFLGARY